MYEFSRFRFDPENHLLECDGSPIPLTPKAFDILLVLVVNGNRLTTKEELMRKVWPDSFVEEANLTVNISALRKQLGETPDGQQYIETVPKLGYRFVAPVVQVHEVLKEIATAASPAAHRAGGPPSSPAADSGVVSSNAPINSQQPARESVWRRFGAA